MRVRAIDYASHDWMFGKGQNDYRKDIQAVMQNIQTRLYAFLGDCFFDQNSGIDWWNLLGAKDQTALNLAISTVILNTQEVTGLLQLFVNLDHNSRVFTVQYQVQTSYSRATGTFVFDQPVSGG